MIATLDYALVKITMRVENDIERSFRAGACAKEPWTVAFIEAMEPGALLIDVGANVGSYTLLAAMLGHPVIAVEPVPSNFARLVENVMLNSAPGLMAGAPDSITARVMPFCCLAGTFTGGETIHYGNPAPGFANHQVGGPRLPEYEGFHSQRILQLRLDDIVTAAAVPDIPRYLKIDVDGGERAVLGGATATLTDERTKAILIEMQLPTEADVTSIITEHGWKLAERYSERSGKPIGNICYGLFRRE